MNTLKGYRIHDQFGCYFLTMTSVEWVKVFESNECKEIIINALKHCKNKKGLLLNAFVIMPNHLHLIVRADHNSIGLSGIIRDFKKYTSRKLIRWISEESEGSQKELMISIFRKYGHKNPKNVHFQLWQQHNCPKIILHPRFGRRKLKYIHDNPVKAGLATAPEYYIYSSARNYAGYRDCILDVDLLDFGVEEGYIFRI